MKVFYATSDGSRRVAVWRVNGRSWQVVATPDGDGGLLAELSMWLGDSGRWMVVLTGCPMDAEVFDGGMDSLRLKDALADIVRLAAEVGRE